MTAPSRYPRTLSAAGAVLGGVIADRFGYGAVSLFAAAMALAALAFVVALSRGRGAAAVAASVATASGPV
jgi:predicted MFS family arabinose efflux permease